VKRSSSWFAVLPSLVIPVCVGMIMYLGLNLAIEHEYITNETLLRYLTGHPVSKVTVGMFFIGLASLALIANNVFEQFNCEKTITLDQVKPPESESDSDDQTDGQSVVAEAPSADRATGKPGDQAVVLATRLTDLPKLVHTHYLFQRLKNALHSVYRNDSTENVEDELKYLADLDLDQQQQRYSLVRILIWATPMLGFLGTVLGISQALGGINVGPENNFQTMMDGLRGSLYVAFDTTALALTLSMLLMFGQFLVDRFESQLLLLVDHRAQSEIGRHLSVAKNSKRESIASEIRQSTEEQTKIWQKTIQSAEKAWASSLTQANMRVQDNMSIALDDNVANLAHYLGEAIEKADNAMSHRWEQWQVTLSENARQLAGQQNSLSEQTELLHKMLAEAKSLAELERVAVSNAEKAATVATPIPDEEASLAETTTGEAGVNLQYRNAKGSETVEDQVAESIEEQVTEMAESSGDSTINFQAYLDGLLTQANQIKAKEKRVSKSEVILPFRFPAESEPESGSHGQSDQPDVSSNKVA